MTGRTGTVVLAIVLSSTVCHAGARDEAHYAKAQQFIREYKACQKGDAEGGGIPGGGPAPGRPRTNGCSRKALRERAVRELTRAIRLDPKRPEYHLARGVLYREEIGEAAAASVAEGARKNGAAADVDRALADLTACADLADGAHAEIRFECRKESALLLCANKREQEGYAIINSLISKNESDLPGGDFYRIRYDCSDKSDKEQNISDLKKAIELYVKRKDYGSPSVLSDLSFELFSEHREMKRYREALEDIDNYGAVCKELMLGCDAWALKGYELATRAEMNRPARWTRAAATGSDVYFVDLPRVIFRSPTSRTAWIRTEPAEDSIIAASQNQQDEYRYQYEMARWHFDCAVRQYSIDAKTYHTIDGELVSSPGSDLADMSMPAAPGTIGAELLDVICGLKPEGQEEQGKADGPQEK
jgi:hypothetical protein